jgi:hypothetical protein
LVFAVFGDMNMILTDNSLVQPDNYHLTFIIDIDLFFENSIQTHDFSYRRFATRDYLSLYNIFYNYDWSCVYSATTVDAAVDSLNAAVQLPMDQAILRDSGRRSKFPSWFSSSKVLY